MRFGRSVIPSFHVCLCFDAYACVCVVPLTSDKNPTTAIYSAIKPFTCSCWKLILTAMDGAKETSVEDVPENAYAHLRA